MQHVNCDVSTICIGLAASFGSFLLAGGAKGKRFALPNSQIMIHQPLIGGNGIQGQATDIEVLCTLLSNRMDKYYSIREYLNYNGLVNLFERMNMHEFAEMLRWFKQYEIDINDNKIKFIMIEKINK